MKARLMATVAGLLLAGNMTLGQSPVAQTPPPILPLPREQVSAGAPAPATGCCNSGEYFGSLPTSPGLFSAEADYLWWYVPQHRRSFPLAATALPKPVVLGTLGDERLDRHGVSGGEFTLGYWLTEEVDVPRQTVRTLGAEFRFFFLGEQHNGMVVADTPNIVRPFFDLNNDKPSEVIVAKPGLATGNIASAAKQALWGMEANGWNNVYHSDYLAANVMGGFRYLGFNTEIDIHRASQFQEDLKAFPEFAGFAGNRILEQESFATHNNFYGGQIGVSGRAWLDPLVLEAVVKLALGATHERIEIQGSQTRILKDGSKVVSPGALLALPSNSGSFSATNFAQVPEFELKAALPVGNRLTFSAGAQALYWSRFARAGDQIDGGIDITQIPNFPGAAGATPLATPRPEVPFRQSSLWVLGATFGVEVTW